ARAGRGDRHELSPEPIAGSEEDLLVVRRPGETVDAWPGLAEGPCLSGAVHHDDLTAVVTEQRMVKEGDPISAAREARLGDPAVGPEEHVSGGKLQHPARADRPDEREVTVPRPVRALQPPCQAR